MTQDVEETPPKRPLFRPEAVAYHAQARTSGRTLDLRERRTVWLFRGLLAAVGCAVALAFTIRAETYARGFAEVGADGRRATVFVADAERLSDAGPLTVRVGGAEVRGRVTGVTGPAELTVELDRRVAPRARGDVVISLGRKPVAALLLGWGR